MALSAPLWLALVPALLSAPAAIFFASGLAAARIAPREFSAAWTLARFASALAAIVAALGLLQFLVPAHQPARIVSLGAWGPLALSFRSDALQALMLSLVTFLARVIVNYSRSYLAGDPREPRYLRKLLHALAAVSLDAPGGATTALVGASGSGKSTGVQLLLRLYDPDAGAVLVDGRDLRSLDVAAFHAATALVPQEPTLFSASIADNIAFARPGATPADVEAAARAAGAHAFISALPAGYATLVGHQGGQLSGGQRARIALARAFVR